MQNTLDDYTKYASEEITRIEEELKGFKDSWLGHLFIVGILFWIWSVFKFESHTGLVLIIIGMGIYWPKD